VPGESDQDGIAVHLVNEPRPMGPMGEIYRKPMIYILSMDWGNLQDVLYCVFYHRYGGPLDFPLNQSEPICWFQRKGWNRSKITRTWSENDGCIPQNAGQKGEYLNIG
jgi:hypothetical protein